MGEIQLLNVDLDVGCQWPLDALLEDLGEEVIVLNKRRARGLYVASMEVSGITESAEGVILEFCETLEHLSKPARAVWNECCTRTFDIGFDSGDAPRSLRAVLNASTIERVAKLGAGIAVTVYAREPKRRGKRGA